MQAIRKLVILCLQGIEDLERHYIKRPRPYLILFNMRVHADDDLSFTGYRQLNDLRHDSAWITSCVLYAHSAICLVVVVAFASYGVVWPVKENSDTLLHKTTRKGTNVQVKISILSSRPLDRRGQTGFIGFVTSRSGTFPVFSTNNGVKRLL